MNYTVYDFNGNPHTVGAPEGTTQEQAQLKFEAFLRSQSMVLDTREKLSGYDDYRKKQALEQAYADTPIYERPLVGAGQSFANTLAGATQLAGGDKVPFTGGMSPKEVRFTNENTPWDLAGNVGYLGAEIGQVAPGAMAARMAGAGPVAAETIASAIQGGVQPGTTGERIANATIGAASGILPATVGGVRPSANAAELIARAEREGVPMRLSAGQQGGRGWGVAEEWTEGTPGIGMAVRSQRRKGYEDWNRLVLNESRPPALPGQPATAIDNYGPAGLKELNEQFNRNYDAITYVAPDTVSLPSAVTGSADDAADAFIASRKNRMTSDNADVVRAEAKDLFDELASGKLPREAFKRRKKDFTEKATAAFNKGEVEVGRAYKELSDTLSEAFKEGLPPEWARLLDETDAKYGDFLPLVRAQALKGAQKRDAITPNDLLGAIRASDDSLIKKRFALGDMPTQAETLRAEEVLGTTIPEVGPGTAEKLGVTGLLGGALASPEWAALGGMSALGGGGAVKALGPFMRGHVPGQAVARDLVDAALSTVPGATSQFTEQGVNAMVPEVGAAPMDLRRLNDAILQLERYRATR